MGEVGPVDDLVLEQVASLQRGENFCEFLLGLGLGADLVFLGFSRLVFSMF